MKSILKTYNMSIVFLTNIFYYLWVMIGTVEINSFLNHRHIIPSQRLTNSSPPNLLKKLFILNSLDFFWNNLLQIIISNNKTTDCITAHSHYSDSFISS